MKKLQQTLDQIQSGDLTLEQLQTQIDDLIERLDRADLRILEIRTILHELGNKITGKIGVKESEIIVRQLVEEELKKKKDGE